MWFFATDSGLRKFCVALLVGFIGAEGMSGAETVRGVAFKKTNRVILDLGEPGSFDECHAKYPCVLRVGEEWWMWYNGRARDCFTGAIGLAKSVDGLNWVKANGGKPVFNHGPPGSFDSTKADHPTVLQYRGKFHMWYTGGDEASAYKIGYATSKDGINWQRENRSQPVIRPDSKGKFDARVALHPCAVRTPDGVIHLWYFGQPGANPVFSIGHATSRDGLHWRKENDGNAVLQPGTVGGLKQKAVYNCGVLYEEGVFRMWYTVEYKEHMIRFLEQSGGISYAESRDGTHWVKAEKPVFFNGARGCIDEYSAYAPSIVRHGKKLWMYYSIAHLEKGKGNPRRNRVGLAIEAGP